MLGLIACGITGICVSMMWPGSLVISSSRVPSGGVFVYAMMAAGGDFGASVGPQLIGSITDSIGASALGESIATALGITTEAVGMKAGMIVGSIFPIIGIILYSYLYATRNAAKSKKHELPR